jgi:putative ATP-dependent endonuclease of the OLD family
MKVSKLIIQNFRGIKTAELFLPDHAVLIGDNNVGKTTVFEALNLVLGPDRLSRTSSVDEHDFYQGRYRAAEGEDPPRILIEATVSHLNAEQRIRFKDYIEWWNEETNGLVASPPPANVDQDHVTAALRVACAARYDEEDDDFVAETYFARSEEEGDRQPFRKTDKQYCGFLYLRSLRTASRALSLERGSLLDIILRMKEIRPQMWEKTIAALADHQVASDPGLGISGVLESIERSIKKFVPREWGVAPHLKVSNLTREHLRKVITAFVATGEGDHAAPFYRQGTGTINLLVLAMLSQVAEDKQNVVFAMEEPETAIPPYAQKRIIHEIRKLASQSLFSSHSPYVLEEFSLPETVILARQSDDTLEQSSIQLPDSVKHKRYRQEFRTRFCEGLLARRVLIAEGATEASAMPAAARRLFELAPATFASLEALGICTLDGGGDSQIADLAGLYRGLGKQVYAVCDKQDEEGEAMIRAEVDELFMHNESGFENLVLKNTTDDALGRFVQTLEWPPHLAGKHPNPTDEPRDALADYFSWSKGDRGIADFLGTCAEEEIPEWIRETCRTLKGLCEPMEVATVPTEAAEVQGAEEAAGLA